MVARHEMPGKCPNMIRPVGNGVILGPLVSFRSRHRDNTDRSYRTLRDGSLGAAFPGIPCQATFISSFQDKYAPLPFPNIPPEIAAIEFDHADGIIGLSARTQNGIAYTGNS
jgi:hypothetical protein